MKIKGNKIIAATLIPLTDDSLAHGDFIAMPSGKKVEIVSGGMLAKAHADAKPAFSLMKPKGASVGVELLDVDSPYESVFVESSVKTSVHRSILRCEMMLPELYCW